MLYHYYDDKDFIHHPYINAYCDMDTNIILSCYAPEVHFINTDPKWNQPNNLDNYKDGLEKLFSDRSFPYKSSG